MKTTWTKEQEKLMEIELPLIGVQEMAVLLNRSKYSVRDKAKSMGLISKNARVSNRRKPKSEECFLERQIMVDELKYFINFSWPDNQQKVQEAYARIDDAVAHQDLNWWWKRRDFTLGQLCEIFVDNYVWWTERDVIRKKIESLKEHLLSGAFETKSHALDLYFGAPE